MILLFYRYFKKGQTIESYFFIFRTNLEGIIHISLYPI